MPRGGFRPGAGRKPGASAGKSADKAKASPKQPSQKQAPPKLDADGYKTDPNWPFGKQEPEPPPDLSDLMPLDYLLGVMRNSEEDKGRRMQAATLAAPYCHPKKGEAGKKEEKAAAAKRVASRFTPAAPPRLAAANGKKI